MSRNYKKFFVVTHARSGSNLLNQCLRTNPNTSVHGELFAGHNRNKQKSFDIIMSDLFSEQEQKISLVGCKVFYYHLNNEEWSKLVDIPDLMIIHLQRKNILRTLTSMKIASQTKKWGSIKKAANIPLSKKIIKFNCEKLKRRIEQVESWQIEIEEKFKNHRIHNIYYEDMITNPNVAMKDLSIFLDLEREILFNPKFKKQNPELLSDLIENYHEICTYFRNTKWQKFLYE